METLSSVKGQALIKPKDLGAAAYSSMNNGNRIEGFAGNRDYIELPISNSGDIDYFNAAGVSQSGWPVAIADVATAVSGTVDRWMGFGFYGSELMIVGVNIAATPDDISLVTVDSAGAITQIGSTVTIGTDFPTAGSYWTVPSSPGASTMYRLNDTGNVFVVQNETDALYEMEINVTTGAIVSVPAKIIDLSGGFQPAYKTASGLYIGSLDYTAAFENLTYHFGVKNAESAIMTVPSTQLPGIDTPSVVVQTKGYRTLITPNIASGALSLARHFDALEFDSGMETLAKMGGVTP